MCSEGVRHDVETLRGHAAGAELVRLPPGDDDDGIESPQDETLQLLINAVLQPSTGEPVYGGYYGKSGFVPGMPAHDVRPVTMCVHDIYTVASAQRSNERPFAEIAAAWHDERYQLHIRVLQRGREIPPVAGGGQRRCHNDSVARAPLRSRQRRHDGLEPPHRSGGEQVQDREWRGQCPGECGGDVSG